MNGRLFRGSCLRHGVIAVMALAFWIGPAVAQKPKKTEYVKEYYQAFKGPPANAQDFKVFGPDNEQCIKFEPDGLRITLPAGHPGTRPTTGVATAFGVTGDFEITLGFEMLQEPEMKDAGPQTRFTLAVNLDKPKPYENQATLNRRFVVGQAIQYMTWMTLWDKEPSKPVRKSNAFPAAQKTGRFRLVRAGANISYLVSEGEDGEFKLLTTYAYGAEDVRDITITASTGSETASLDVRVLDLRVRAAAFPRTGPVKVADVPAPPAKNYAQTYFQSFKASPENTPGWDLIGPGAEQHVRFEKTGLRITLPTGWGGDRPSTGLKSSFGVKGDFEITMNFEILKEPEHADAGGVAGTRVTLGLIKDVPKQDVTTLNRSVLTNGTRFVGWSSLWNGVTEKRDSHASTRTTKATAGRLRLVRTGADLYYGVAERLDGEFIYFKKFPFGAEDLLQVRIIAVTGGDKAALNVRVTDLRIRADAIPNMPTGSPTAGAAGDPTPAPNRGWLVAVLLIAGLSIVIIAVSLVAGYILLRHRVAPKAAVKTSAAATKPNAKSGTASKK